MIYLRQSTASQEIPLGYFLDSTDGNTEETGLTINNTDIKLWKMGAITLANKNSGGATHISNGIYYATLDATDTNTLGSLIIFVHVAGALAVRLECCVLTANIYDSWIAGTDYQQVDSVQVEGSDATDQIRDSVVDDATRIDASLLNTLSGLAPASIIASAANVSAVETDTQDIQSRIPAALVGGKIDANMGAISGDTIAADNCELDYDGTGYAKTNSTIGTCTTNTDMRGTDNAALASVCTEGRLSELDAANIPADIDAILTDTGTTIPTQITNLNDITVADIIAGIADGTFDFQEMTRIIFAFASGKSNGGGTNTHNFRDSADTKNRISATVDADGNRTAVTLDGS